MIEKATATDAEAAARVRDIFSRSIELKKKIIERHCEDIAVMAKLCVRSLAAGGKLLLCGNGGSAADAQHFAAELLVRLRPEINRPAVPAIALTMDSSSMTACGNDYSFEVFFARMVEALGKPGDVLLGITTSGNSPNILKALETARRLGMTTIGLLGGSGPAPQFCDASLIVPSSETGRVQEVHITAGHALMELIEDGLLAGGTLTRA